MRKETADLLPDAILPIRQELLDAMMVARGIEELERLLGAQIHSSADSGLSVINSGI